MPPNRTPNLLGDSIKDSRVDNEYDECKSAHHQPPGPARIAGCKEPYKSNQTHNKPEKGPNPCGHRSAARVSMRSIYRLKWSTVLLLVVVASSPLGRSDTIICRAYWCSCLAKTCSR